MRKVALIGSTTFQDKFRELERDLTLNGNVVLGLSVFGRHDLPDYDWTNDPFNYKARLTVVALHKIDMADLVWVVDVDGYIGEATRMEMEYAKSLSKPILLLSKDYRATPLLDDRLHRRYEKADLTLCGKSTDAVIVYGGIGHRVGMRQCPVCGPSDE